MGYGLIFTPLLLKNWRIVTLFNNRKLRKISIPNSLLLKYEAIIGGTMALILVLWTIEDPLTWIRTVVRVDPVSGLPVESEGHYLSETSLRYLVLLISFVLSFLVIGNYLSYKARKIPVKFSEGKWIAVALINYLECFVLCVPIMIVSAGNPSMNGIVRSMFVLICNISTMVIIFGPKLHAYLSEVAESTGTSNGATDGTSTKGTLDRNQVIKPSKGRNNTVTDSNRASDSITLEKLSISSKIYPSTDAVFN